MKQMVTVTLISGLLALAVACGSPDPGTAQPPEPSAAQQPPPPAPTAAQETQPADPLEVVAAFEAAGLEAADARPATPDDLGLAPMVHAAAARFLIPSLGADAGGRVFSFHTIEDLRTLQEFYERAGRESAILFSWVFVNVGELLLVQINGDLPEEQAQRYAAVLQEADGER